MSKTIILSLALAVASTSAFCVFLYRAGVDKGLANRSEMGVCNCTIDYNGSQISIEDAINLLQEGLSIDQADEVQIMINNSIGR